MQQAHDLNSKALALESFVELDWVLARQLAADLPSPDPRCLHFLVLLLSRAVRQGHSCLLLGDLAKREIEFEPFERNSPSECYRFPSKQKLEELTNEMDLESKKLPLVLDKGRLYLRRYWAFERELKLAIESRLSLHTEWPTARLEEVLAGLFDTPAEKEDRQRLAVSSALTRKFFVLAGGPGTGKTTTITALLVAIQQLESRQLKTALAAPTGKAAQRMIQAVTAAKRRFQHIDSSILHAIPDNASTMHRLLGVRRDQLQFRHNQDHPLDLDVLVVDEASMIDLPLMARLFRALRQDTRVILVGDPNQLPSVETGGVFAAWTGTNPNLLSLKENSCPSMVWLRESHRFDKNGAIAQLSKLVLEGKPDESWQTLADDSSECSLAGSSLEELLNQYVTTHLIPIFEAQTAEEAMSSFENSRLLAVTRHGSYSVTQINQILETFLMVNGHISRPEAGKDYRGKPILVTQNNFELDLYNGDTGLIWPDSSGELKAVFPTEKGLRWVSTSRLPPHETVFAMTVHKTQGSEFKHVTLVMPDRGIPLLSRELLYTAITRARTELNVFCERETWSSTVSRSLQRTSGLPSLADMSLLGPNN